MKSIVVDLYRSYIADILKFKGSKVLFISVISPLFLVALFFTIFLFKTPNIVGESANGWNMFMGYASNSGLAFFFPLFIILITSMISRVEYDANAWKQIYALPIRRGVVYTSKIIMTITIVLLSLILFGVFFVIAGEILALIYPENYVETADLFSNITKLLIMSFVASLAWVGIQFWATYRWKNMVLPIAFGIVGFVVGAILIRWEFSIYVPFTYLLQAATSIKGETFNILGDYFWYSLAYSALFIIIGYVELKLKKRF